MRVVGCKLGFEVVVLACCIGGLLFGGACKDEPLRPPPGGPCVKNSDCKDPLSCTFGLCHEACKEARDCATDQTCVRVTPTSGKPLNVCQLAVEAGCLRNSDCDGELQCAPDFQCRTQCEQDKDCPTKTQKCVETVCAEPVDTMKDKETNLLVLKPGMPPSAAGAGMSGGAGRAAEAAGKAGSSKAGAGGAAAGSSAGSGGGHSGTGGAASAGTRVPLNVGSGDPPPPTCDGQSGFKGFHPSNLPVDLELPAGLIPVVSPCAAFNTNDTDTKTPMSSSPHWVPSCGSVPATASQVVKLADGREAAVLLVESLTVEVGRTLTFTGDRPLIILSTGRVEINGTIAVTAEGVTGWYGGGAPSVSGASRPGRCPIDEALGGGRAGSNLASTGLGSGGGGFCGLGGAGSTDLNGTSRAAGGEAYGTPELIPLVGGSSGGTATATAAGYGGGALQIVSGTEIVIGDNGTISMPGGGGGDGSGAGSGGAILLEAPSVTLRGILAANGGAANEIGHGASGSQPGQPSDQPALSSYAGGKGSAGDMVDGSPGNAAGTKLTFAGGGGGSGYIRINTGCGGKLTVTSAAIISPHQGTQCFSQGALR